MFTGIVRELGEVESVARDDRGARLRVRAALAGELREGDSVSVGGVCLTASALGEGWLEADAMNQTLAVTTLGALAPGDAVNLEPALRAGDPLGGHIVAGHVDGVGSVRHVEQDGIARRLWIDVPPELGRYVAARGSIAVEGVSLTVAAVDERGFEVSLIPESLQRSTLGDVSAGAQVNVEIDVVARYAERLLSNLEEGGGSDAS